jgi:hypothetical protein
MFLPPVYTGGYSYSATFVALQDLPLIMFSTSVASGVIYNIEGISKIESLNTKIEIERQKPKTFEH